MFATDVENRAIILRSVGLGIFIFKDKLERGPMFPIKERVSKRWIMIMFFHHVLSVKGTIRGECVAGLGVCFCCGSTDHKLRHCPWAVKNENDSRRRSQPYPSRGPPK